MMPNLGLGVSGGGGSSSSPVTSCSLTSDFETTSGTLVNVTGMSLAIPANTPCWFSFHLIYQSASTANAIQFGFDTISNLTQLSATHAIVDTSGAATPVYLRDSESSSPNSAGPGGANTDYTAQISGVVLCSAASTLQLACESESGGTTVRVMTGSSGVLISTA